MKERHQKVKIWTSQKPKKEACLKIASESLPLRPPRKKKKMEDQHLEKAFELLTSCSNQTMNNKGQCFGNMIATKLRNYNDTI
jgi:hypothetical protein